MAAEFPFNTGDGTYIPPEKPTPILVASSGSPDDRPHGFPCFGCGGQVDQERGVPVEWPDGRRTTEAVCGDCAPLYGLDSDSTEEAPNE